MRRLNIVGLPTTILCVCGHNFQPYSGGSIFGGVPITTRRMLSSISRTRTSTTLLGVTTTICQTSLFFTTTLVIPSFQSVTIFCLAATYVKMGIP
jgi:hypothetical protein